jgi:hypothetical protein
VNVQIRDQRRGYWLHSVISDLKFGFRNSRTRPSFSVMVIGMLTLGIAGNAAELRNECGTHRLAARCWMLFA